MSILSDTGTILEVEVTLQEVQEVGPTARVTFAGCSHLITIEIEDADSKSMRRWRRAVGREFLISIEDCDENVAEEAKDARGRSAGSDS